MQRSVDTARGGRQAPSVADAREEAGSSTPVRLAFGVHPLVRGPRAVQFGLDAARAGIAEVPRPAAMVKALESLDAPTPLSVVRERFAAAGLGGLPGELLLGDLLATRILVRVPARAPRVVVLGRSRLAEATCGLLHARGVQTRRPLAGESDELYLSHFSPGDTTPVVVIDRLAHFRVLAAALAAHARVCVPVNMVDRCGVIGPVRIDECGACPQCVAHHQVDRDPRWARLVAQQPAGPARPDPIVAAYTAGLAAELAAALCADPGGGGAAERAASCAAGAIGACTPPRAGGIGGEDTAPRLGPGGFAVVGAGARITRGHLGRHPRCPVCWAVSAGRISPGQPATRRQISRP